MSDEYGYHEPRAKTLELTQKLELMLIGAERYACGRRTYIVSDTVGYLIAQMPKLSDWCLRVMDNDMGSIFGMAERTGQKELLGDACDYSDWLKFYNALSVELRKRELSAELRKRESEGK